VIAELRARVEPALQQGRSGVDLAGHEELPLVDEPDGGDALAPQDREDRLVGRPDPHEPEVLTAEGQVVDGYSDLPHGSRVLSR
jgi:hypothetical protein